MVDNSPTIIECYNELRKVCSTDEYDRLKKIADEYLKGRELTLNTKMSDILLLKLRDNAKTAKSLSYLNKRVRIRKQILTKQQRPTGCRSCN